MSEPRWPCPVCLGVKMEKATVATRSDDDAGELTLDHCPRCGGMWFELGEVQRLRSEPPASLWTHVPARAERHRAQCHACRAFLDRDEPKCGACGARARLNCPACDTRMLWARRSELTLDVCKQCKGVWFDHHELEAIWELKRDQLIAQHGRRGGKLSRSTEGEGAALLFEGVLWAPELLAAPAYAASAAAEAAPVVGEAVGEAASGVFETIVEIVVGVLG